MRQRPGRQQRPLKLELTCKDCGLTLSLQAFVPIKGTRNSYHGRCQDCRAKHARERYWTDRDERERQKARVKRNRECRRLKREGATALA